ncbi:N-6 DNA methylase, partial [Candidatus Pacearchaeota archaeon]|nr:N-6 DNA methylase [Candidatus Pacearchaeota archaeon]
RKALGTHATPSWLVNYMVWGELADWIEEIPQDKRIVLEPACGHAPFLTAAAKLLSFLYRGKEMDRHNYLIKHLIGIEKDAFAEEIARLVLTLADIPNKDGWQIENADVYEGNLLTEAAKHATILLCNPPFENFSKEEKEENGGIETGNKAAEVLTRTLRYMPDGSVFGIVLPQGFLHRKNLAPLRKYILDNCELRKICILPDKVFPKAGHPSSVLLGRKRNSKKKVSYVRVRQSELETFRDSYQAKEEAVRKDDFYKAEHYSFRVPELRGIWECCSGYVTLGNIAEVGRGVEYKGKKSLPDNTQIYRRTKKTGYGKGFVSYSKDIQITDVPQSMYMNLSREVIRRPLSGTSKGVPQIILNSIRASNTPWRLKGWIDNQGYHFNPSFSVIRPISQLPLEYLWALINSPFANAFVYCHSMEKHNKVETLRSIPVPSFNSNEFKKIALLVKRYFEVSTPLAGLSQTPGESAKDLLFSIDAEILRLYDLPPRQEKQLLDFFAGYQRKGVDFKFDRYYPENFGSSIPLRMFISEEFQNATIDRVEKWVEENRAPEVVKALDNARKVFEED